MPARLRPPADAGADADADAVVIVHPESEGEGHGTAGFEPVRHYGRLRADLADVAGAPDGPLRTFDVTRAERWEKTLGQA
jgi:hypothetical protein